MSFGLSTASEWPGGMFVVECFISAAECLILQPRANNGEIDL